MLEHLIHRERLRAGIIQPRKRNPEWELVKWSKAGATIISMMPSEKGTRGNGDKLKHTEFYLNDKI